MHHPSNSFSFADLHAELLERQSRKLVKLVRAPDNENIVLFCYTKTAAFDVAWDPVVELARGLVLDVVKQRVLARPFPKFFNHGERSAALPDEPFQVQEKLDGSLGIVFHDGKRWRVATKGSFIAEQSAWAEEWLSKRDISVLTEGSTYLFEIIYTTNRVVIKYDFEGLVLLGAYDAAGAEFARPALVDLAAALSTRVCDVHEFSSIEEVLGVAAGYAADKEGFVVRFESGYRVKIKGAAYLRIHRLISRVTPIAIWEALSNGDNLDAIRKEIPEEFWADFDQIRQLLVDKFDEIVKAVDLEKAVWKDKTDKEVGLGLSKIQSPVNSLIFSARKEGDKWASAAKVRATIFRGIRPTGNVLLGYEPSQKIERVQNEAG